MKAAEARTRVQVSRILFLTDFSKAAGAAIPYAAEIAKRFGAKLYALHVQEPVVNPMTPPTTWAVLEKAAEVETKAQQKTLIESFPQLKPEVMIGEPVRRKEVFHGFHGGGDFSDGTLRGDDRGSAFARGTAAGQ